MSAVNLRPIDPLRGPLDVTVAVGTTWTSPPWNNLTHRACTTYISSDRAVTLRIDHASSEQALLTPVSSTHAVAAGTPASFHEKLDGRVSQVRIQNSSGADATVTLDVILRSTAEDHASTRLTLAGVDVSSGHPLPVSQVGTLTVDAVALDTRQLTSATDSVNVSGTVLVNPGGLSLPATVSQDNPSALQCTVTQAGTVSVAAVALDTRPLTSATDSITVTGNVLVNSGGLSLPATVSQDDPSALQATVTQAGTVAIEGLEMLVATVLSPKNAAGYPIVGACRVYGVFFAHGSSNVQNLALYDATSGVAAGSTRKFSLT